MRCARCAPNSGGRARSEADNLELLEKFKDVDDAQISGARLAIERVSRFFGSPAYFAFAVVFNLLSEQKVTKILQIVDELQRELTAMRQHPDSQVTEMSKPADAQALMHAIKQKQTDR